MARAAFIALALVTAMAVGFVVIGIMRPPPGDGDASRELAQRLDRLEKGLGERLAQLERRLAAARPASAEAVAAKDEAESALEEPTPEERTAMLETRLEALEERVNGLAQDPLSRGFAYAASSSAELRRRGIRALAQVARSDPEALATVRALLDDPDPGVRREAAQAVQQAGDQASVPRLLELSADADANVRERAIKSAAHLLEKSDPADPRRQSAAAAVAARLGDADVQVRRAAAEVLGEFRRREVVPALVAGLEDPDREVREEIIRSLGDLGDPSAEPPLRALYGQGESPLALDLAAALRRMGDDGPMRTEIAKLSRQVVESTDEEARRNAVRALGRYGGEAAREVLQQAANDASPRVRQEAQRVLRELARN